MHASGKKRSIFARIFIAGIVPLAFFFFAIVFSINLIIRHESENYARNTTRFFAEQLSSRIQDLFTVMGSALTLTKEHLETIDYSDPNAAASADNMIFSLASSVPSLYSAWLVFEPDVILADKRFARSYINGKSGIEGAFEVPQSKLKDPAQSPWYNIPLHSGNFYFASVLAYDYGIGGGNEFTATMSFPIRYDDEIIGCVGADAAYDHLLSFMNDLKVLDTPVSLYLITRNKEIVYSNTDVTPGAKELLLNENDYNECINLLKPVMHYAKDTYSGQQYFISLSPLDITKTSTQLFLYVELPSSALKSLASRPTGIVLVISCVGFLLLMSSVILATRSITKPVKQLISKAENIASGKQDLEFTSESTSTKELDVLNLALNRMLIQLGQIHSLKLAAITADFEREKLKAASSAKSNFFASMSHEIRTPMNAISGLSELLLGMQLGEAQRRYVQDIKISADALLKIINDILDSAKMEAGKLELMPREYDFAAMLDSLTSIVAIMACEKNLHFEMVHTGEIPQCLFGDAERLRQILLNILSNAVKYTKEGFVRLHLTNEGETLLFCVMDSGIGIKNEAMALIFDPYSQVGGDRTKHIEGTGLGLSITKQLVEMMRGELWVESRYGHGSNFYVRIPKIEGDPAILEKEKDILSMSVHWQADVLVVDDNKINLNVARGLLKQHGLSVHTALSGQEALSMVRSKKYDLIFMDHMMPEMDGVETTQAIRNMGEEYRHLPIIALTANAMPGTKELLLDKGMDDFLAKPIEVAMLRLVLDKWLKPSKKQIVTKNNPEKSDAEEQGQGILSEVLQAVCALDDLDLQTGLDRVCGQQDTYEISLRLLAETLAPSLVQANEAFLHGRLEEMGNQAHAIKGALANIGAMELSKTASNLEEAARQENTELWQSAFPIFYTKAMALQNTLAEILVPLKRDNLPPGDFNVLQEELEKVLEALDGYDYECANAGLELLASFSFGENADAAIASAKSALSRFSYDEAATMLKDWQSWVRMPKRKN